MQVFCCLITAGIPCDKEVPCTVAFLGYMCYPRRGCLVQVKHIFDVDKFKEDSKGHVKDKKGGDGGPPAGLEMVR